jgi:hypothetical protein
VLFLHWPSANPIAPSQISTPEYGARGRGATHCDWTVGRVGSLGAFHNFTRLGGVWGLGAWGLGTGGPYSTVLYCTYFIEGLTGGWSRLRERLKKKSQASAGAAVNSVNSGDYYADFMQADATRQSFMHHTHTHTHMIFESKRIKGNK